MMPTTETDEILEMTRGSQVSSWRWLQVLVGFWAVGYAGRSIALLVVWVGASALARGISSIFLGFGLHNSGRELRRRLTMLPPPPAAPRT